MSTQSCRRNPPKVQNPLKFLESIFITSIQSILCVRFKQLDVKFFSFGLATLLKPSNIHEDVHCSILAGFQRISSLVIQELDVRFLSFDLSTSLKLSNFNDVLNAEEKIYFLLSCTKVFKTYSFSEPFRFKELNFLLLKS